MKTEKFGDWYVDSWEGDFSPMMFRDRAGGKPEVCVEVTSDGLELVASFDEEARTVCVPVSALMGLLARAAEFRVAEAGKKA